VSEGRRRFAEKLKSLAQPNSMGIAKLSDQNTILPDSKYALIEREKRYLLRELPPEINRADAHLQITDNYITGTRLRIRKVRDPKTNKWVVKFTQKFAPDGVDFSHTTITNIYLNAIEADTLAVFASNEIRKNRYPFEFEGRRFTIDVFLGDLLGLVLAETSFDDDAEMNTFPLPSFALADVTNNPAFTGGKLCEQTFDDIRKEIESSGLLKSNSAS
jgi:CYTH domain-containing protein